MLMLDANSPFAALNSPLQPLPKKEFAEERLTTAILWCEIPPGTTATEANLADRFGIGRAATRSALAKLAAQGLVEATARLGWRVLPMTGALVGDVIAARRLAEQGLAGVALAQNQIERAMALAEMISVMSHEGDDHGALPTRRGYERAFCDLVLCGVNALVAGFVSSLWDHTDRIVRFFEQTGAEPLAAMQAKALAEALAARDGVRIVQIRLAEIDCFQDFASRALLSHSTELTWSGNTATSKPKPKKRVTEKPATSAARAAARGRPSRSGRRA